MYIVYEPFAELYFHSYKEHYVSLSSTNPLIFLWLDAAIDTAMYIGGEVYEIPFFKVEI